MTNHNKQSAHKAPRADWRRPEVKRLVAGEAEASGAPIADVVYS